MSPSFWPHFGLIPASSRCPRARKADTVLAVDPIEDVATQVPMIARILRLLMIDILTVSVALRRPARGSASPLARMTLQSR